jgi:hypothetical protein
MTDPDPILTEFLDALDDVPDNRTIDEVKAELREQGIDADDAIARIKSRIETHLKEQRLSWRKDVAIKRAAFQQTRTSTPSWCDASEAEIEGAYREHFARSNATDTLALAFRGKKEISVQDKAHLLDSLRIVRCLPPDKADPQK